MLALIGPLWLVLSPLAATDSDRSSALDELTAEAATIRLREPERWRECEKDASQVFTENERRKANWRMRSGPPKPDLAPLKLPLAFLVDRMLSEPQLRRGAYFAAIIHSDDDRRIAALCEYRDRELALPRPMQVSRRWNSILAEAATLPWAVAQLAALPPDSAPAATLEDDLVYCLGKRFAAELPEGLRDKAYEYLLSCRNIEPRHYPCPPWDVLFRLDASRASTEILPYFYKRDRGRDSRQAERKAYIASYNLATLHLLREFAGESPELAHAVRQWLASGDVLDYDKPALRGILLRADPAHELEPAVQRLDSLLNDQQRTGKRFQHDHFGGYGGDVGDLLRAMTKINSSAADRATVRFVYEPAIDAALRFQLLESLVKHRYEKSSDVIARWLREERAPWPQHLRKDAVERWGDFGRKALETAERLNRQPGD